MPRIISGAFKGRILTVPKGQNTRPTSDRVKEALFSVLQGCIQYADVLDLFAGSGALGLEAMSRGAKSAVFVDNGREALAAVKKNIKALDCGVRTSVMGMDYMSAIAMLKKRGKYFDIAFLDPPYAAIGDMLPSLLMALLSIMRGGSFVVVEHPRAEFYAVDGFSITDTRRYGDIFLTFFKRSELDATI